MEKNYEYIDDLVRNGLSEMEVAYDASDWDIMDSRLDEEREVQMKLFFFKGIEMVLLIGAIYTLFQFMPTNNYSSSDIHPIEETVPDSNTKQIDTKVLPVAPKPEENTTDQNNTQANINASEPMAHQKNTKNKNKVFDDSGPPPPDIGSIVKRPDGLSNQTKLISNNQIISKPNETAYSKNFTLPSISDELQDNTNQNILFAEIFDGFLQSKNSDLWMTSDELDTPEFLSTTTNPGDPIPEGKPKVRYLGFMASPDMNFIGGEMSMGFNAGALYNREFTDHWNLETGLFYSLKAFDFVPMEGGEPTSDEFTKARQHVVEIPVNASYSFNRSKNWHSYTTFGTSANFIVAADYNKDNLSVDYTLDAKSSQGLVQGGSFKDNFYLTANVGIGLERKLTDKVNLFIQPTLKYPLMKSGPNNDRSGSFSLSMGARASL